jgi:putative membrane protein
MGTLGGCTAGVGGGLLGLALMAMFWVGVIALIAYSVRGFGRATPTLAGTRDVGGDRALATLRDRYARGQIDHGEYEERRRALVDDLPAL